MMWFLLAFALAGVVSTQGRTFNNPVLSDEPYYYPGAMKIDGTYYIISMSLSTTTSKQLVIHSSTDLINWKNEGFVFDDNNRPDWPANLLWHPEIHQVNGSYLIYYGALDGRTSSYEVGAAIGAHPLGPYLPIDEPIVPDLIGGIYCPTIINDEDALYLVWTNDFTIFARPLNTSGFTLATEEVTTLLDSDLPWEGGYLRSPWYMRRGDYHYLFYTGNPSCNAMGVGVARSRNSLGPYEKLAEPILVNNGKFTCPSGASIVKDLDDQNDIIVFTAFQADDIDQVWSILLASLSWNDDDWPYVEEF